ncbi:PQQ-dependent sugar dehydrogenase [Isoptericola sp. NPDC019693]|uniref:PQQ-dependent sugar dehydrogenase n=1 Tax=Isoptericola sp. NPDC019693 TaxID=3364009 RepID=UPI0037B623C9
MARHPRRTAAVAALVGLPLLLLAGCGPAGGPPDDGPAPSAPRTAAGTSSPSPGSSPSVAPRASVETVVDGLDVPWGLATLPDGALLISLRDEARLVVVDPDAGTTTAVTGPGADALAAQTTPDGEGGLLGVARDPGSGDVFVYRTGADDNAVLRASLDGTVLGGLTTVLDGIPRAGHHDGGGLAFGPDGFLYVGTGDAGDGEASQDRSSLAGKILRVTTDGDPAPGNPDPSSPVWTFGHRNVQGLGWDGSGRMFASEFGQSTWDELNVIEPGGDYGWPDVEGPGLEGQPRAGDGTVAPVAWWPTSDASPSGLTVTDDAVYLAGLRGERLWRVPFGSTASGADEGADEGAGTGPTSSKGAVDADGSVRGLGEPQALLDGELGRLRNVAPVVPGGGDADGLWVLTNNTDGRGSPRDGDDRLVRVTFG